MIINSPRDLKQCTCLAEIVNHSIVTTADISRRRHTTRNSQSHRHLECRCFESLNLLNAIANRSRRCACRKYAIFTLVAVFAGVWGITSFSETAPCLCIRWNINFSHIHFHKFAHFTSPLDDILRCSTTV